MKVVSNEETDQVTPHLALVPSESNAKQAGLRATTAVKEIQKQLERAVDHWDTTILFSTFGGATVGVYVGESLNSPSVAESLFVPFMDKIRTAGIAPNKSALLQVCGDDRAAIRTFGVIATANTDFSIVQSAVKSWANADCVDTTTYTELTELDPMHIRAQPQTIAVVSNFTSNSTFSRLTRMDKLSGRDECRTEKVYFGDTCGALAGRCGISPNDFVKYNTDKKLCGSLKEGQHVCCTSGTLPDFRPKQNDDGSCFIYQTQANDTCSAIGAEHGLEVDSLEELNKNTWGEYFILPD